MKVKLNDIASKKNWVSVSNIMRHCPYKAYFVKTPKSNIEFFQYCKKDSVNITNWNSVLEKHIFYKLDVINVDNKDLYVVETYESVDNTLLQSNTFNTIKEVQSYLKDR